MKKIIYLSASIVAMFFTACTKDNDFVKDTLEKALPVIEVSSLGLQQQTGPFTTTSVIQVTFGGAITNAQPGTFDYAWYDGNTLADSVHFPSWTEKATAATANQAITTTLLPTSYANTQAFTGNLVIKLANLTGGGKSYTLKVYARTGGDKPTMATVSVSKLITVN